MSTNQDIYKTFDLSALNLLPPDWKEHIAAVVETYAERSLLDGKSSSSREPEGIEPVEVFVVAGSDVAAHLPWLHRLYTDELCALASQVAGHQVFPASDVRSSININVLKGRGSRYEWHVDTNPLTGIIYVTDHPSDDDGGELLFRLGDQQIAFNPRAGMFIAFDAREIPHTVMPLKKDEVRISIPMNYYDSPDKQTRPSDLDPYLYGTDS